jgi:hypothetical protein
MLLSNSYTAQSSLSQGRELDRVASKLDRAQGNVAAAERDLRTFLGALGETWGRWVDGWKTFCDEAQDLEEERVDFLKDVCWAYANAVSSVCVVDDEVGLCLRFLTLDSIAHRQLSFSPSQACERMRVSLESVDSFAEAAAFVRVHATSGKIPDPPRFVNYAAGEREPEEVAFRQARFVRRTERPAPTPPAANGAAQLVEEDLAPRQDAEEVGEVQRAMQGMGLEQAQPPTQAAMPAPASRAPVPQQQQQQQPPAPATTASASQQPSYQQQKQQLPPKPPQSLMSPPPHPSQIPPPPSSWTQPPVNSTPAQAAAVIAQPVEDPIAKALADLQAKRMSRQGSYRSTASRASRHSQVPASPRESVLSPAMQGGGAFGGPSPSLLPPMGGSTSSALTNSQADFDARSNGSHGGTALSRNDPRRRSVDYSQAGESIVGHHPASRPSSPSPSAAGRAPSPALMQAPILPPSALPVEQVLENYNQSFPGEARGNRARRNSAASDAASAYRQSIAVPSSASQAGHGDRSPSREGFAGVGTSIARAASPTPSFGGQQNAFPNRAPSPSPSFGYQQQQQQQQQGYPGRAPSPNPSYAQQQQQSGLVQSLQQPPARGASPAPSQMSRRSIGIALGSNGAVDRDEMADSYRSSSVPPGPAPAPPQVPAQPSQPAMSPHLQQQQLQYPQQTQQTMYSAYAPPPGASAIPGQLPQHQAYGAYPAAAYGYAPPPPQGYPAYGQPQQYAGYAPPPATGSMAAPPPPSQAQAGSSQQGHAGRSGSVVSHHSAQGYQQAAPAPQHQMHQQQPPAQQQQQQQQQQQLPPPQQAQQQQGPPPSPHSPGAYDQHTDAGQPVIFYGA